MAILTTTKTWRAERKRHARRTPDLTPEEQENVKRALRVLRKRFGSGSKLDEAMGLKVGASVRVLLRVPTAGIALRAARLAGVSMEAILAGEWPQEGACPHCGRYGPGLIAAT